jgi:predicted O-methyltransferase YrrM
LFWSTQKTETSNFYYDLTERNLDELANFVATITGIPLDKIQSYIEEIKSDTQLHQHIRSSLLSDDSMKHSQLQLGRRIGWYAFARATKPKLVVETGVHQGIGAVTLIRALEKNALENFPGRYVGTDIDPLAGGLVNGEFLLTGHVAYGDSIETLAGLDEEIDLFINDSDHSSEYEYREYETVVSKLNSKAIILGDNSHSTDSLMRFSSENQRSFLLFRETPKNHWYPGAGIGCSFIKLGVS